MSYCLAVVETGRHGPQARPPGTERTPPEGGERPRQTGPAAPGGRGRPHRLHRPLSPLRIRNVGKHISPYRPTCDSKPGKIVRSPAPTGLVDFAAAWTPGYWKSASPTRSVVVKLQFFRFVCIPHVDVWCLARRGVSGPTGRRPGGSTLEPSAGDCGIRKPSSRGARNRRTPPSRNARPPVGSRAGSETTEQAGRNLAQCGARRNSPATAGSRTPERSRSPSTAMRWSERSGLVRPSPRRQTSYCGSIRERSERFHRSTDQPVRWSL